LKKSGIPLPGRSERIRDASKSLMKKEANMDLLEAKWQPAAPKNIEKKNRK
jgi:hypothetical protein